MIQCEVKVKYELNNCNKVLKSVVTNSDLSIERRRRKLKFFSS